LYEHGGKKNTDIERQSRLESEWYMRVGPERPKIVERKYFGRFSALASVMKGDGNTDQT
jgi:hypothetical protein